MLKAKRARALELRKLLRRLHAVVDLVPDPRGPSAELELESAFASCSEGDNLIPERQRRYVRYVAVATRTCTATCNCAVATRDR